jgi:hypothetical protein
MKYKFRVEVNNGSKYFTDSEKAFFFYELKKQQPMSVVQIWKFITPTTQELISPVKGDCGYADAHTN